MTLKDFKLILLLFLFSLPVIGQNKISGYITNGTDNTAINNVQVFEKSAGLLTTSDAKGYYEFSFKNDSRSSLNFEPLISDVPFPSAYIGLNRQRSKQGNSIRRVPKKSNNSSKFIATSHPCGYCNYKTESYLLLFR